MLLTVRDRCAPGARFERRVLLAVRERFAPRASSGKKMDINGPGPFWLPESAFKVFAFTVLEPFGSMSQLLERSVIYGPETVYDSGSQRYFRVLLFTIRDPRNLLV